MKFEMPVTCVNTTSTHPLLWFNSNFMRGCSKVVVILLKATNASEVSWRTDSEREIVMEHYKKKQSRLYEDPCLPNEMRVSASGKAHDLTTKALHKLKEHPEEGIVVSASGGHVTKAVTVVELLKRKLPNLEQETQIKYARIEDIWEPDMDGLEMLKVTRRIPAISMHLKSTTESHDLVSLSVQQSHDMEQEKTATKQPTPRTRNKPAKLKGLLPTTSRGRGKGRGRSHDDK